MVGVAVLTFSEGFFLLARAGGGRGRLWNNRNKSSAVSSERETDTNGRLPSILTLKTYIHEHKHNYIIVSSMLSISLTQAS